MRFLRKILYAMNRNARRREIEEEIALHRAMTEDEHRENGLSPDDARHATARRLGNASVALEVAHAVWFPAWLEGLMQDLRHAWRGLRRTPVLVAMVCLSLGLSTGFGTALFSVINAVLLQPVTARDPDSLVWFEVGPSNRMSWLNLQDLCEATSQLTCIGYAMEEFQWQHGAEPLRLFTQVVSPEYFIRLGIPIAQGRAFTNESVSEETDVAVVSHAFWQRRLNGDPKVVGRKLVLDSQPYTIVGVLPARFRSLYGLGVAPSFYVPANSSLRAAKNEGRGNSRYELLATLGPNQTLPQLRAIIQARANDLERLYPIDNVEYSRSVRAEHMHRLGLFLKAGESMTTVLLLFGSVLMILVLLLTVVACINVAGMLVARAMARAQEISVRVSLGCGKMRLGRLLMAESFLLSMAGVAAGAVLSVWLARMLVAVPLPFPIPFEVIVPVDLQLFAFLALIVGMATAVSGIAPILQAWRLSAGVRSGRGIRGWSRRWSLRGALIVGQIAVSTILLVATELFVRSLWSASQIHPGFDLDRVATIEMDTRTAQMNEAELAAYHTNVVERLKQEPNVSAVSGAIVIPLTLDTIVNSLQIDRGDKPQNVKVTTNYILPDYFQVMGIALRSGRDFGPNDRQPKPTAVIVNHAFVRQHFPDGDALGNRVRRPAPRQEMPPWAEIVGVVADSRYMTLGEDTSPLVYWPLGPASDVKMKIHVRTEGEGVALARHLPAILRSIDPRVSTSVQPLRAVMSIALFPSQAAALMLSALGIVAWVLSVAGLYGVVAYSVSRRIPEIGIRMALGATPRSILRLLLKDGIALAVVGVAIGIAVALAGAPALDVLLAGVTPFDPATYLSVAVALLVTAAAASYWPARKGTSLTPSNALRNE